MTGEAGQSAPPRPHWLERVRGWHLAATFLLLSVPGLASIPLSEPDEGRYAEIPREMLATGDLVTPHLDGMLYFEKPPLYYWLVAGSFRLLGVHEFSARLISLLAALAGVLLTFWLARSMAGHRAGVYAGTVMVTSPLWAIFGRLNAIDMTLSTLILATLAAFWCTQRATPNDRRKSWLTVAALSALTVLTKGLIGVVIPGAVVVFYLLATSGWRQLRTMPWISGTLVFAVIALPWHALVALRNPTFLWFYFVHEHFLRYTTDISARPGPFWFFVPVVILGVLPWAGLLPLVVRRVWRLRADPLRPELTFLTVWFGFIFLFFSASSSKLVPYILPAMPALAILLGLVMVDLEQRMGRPSPSL